MGENGWRAASPKESRPSPNPKCTLPPPPPVFATARAAAGALHAPPSPVLGGSTKIMS